MLHSQQCRERDSEQSFATTQVGLLQQHLYFLVINSTPQLQKLNVLSGLLGFVTPSAAPRLSLKPIVRTYSTPRILAVNLYPTSMMLSRTVAGIQGVSLSSSCNM